MKLKLMPMLVGAIAITLTAAPFALNAQADTFDSYRIGQAQNGRFDQGRFAGIDLTEKQQEQMADIRQDTQEKIQNILTPAQREQMRSLMQNRRDQGGMRANQGGTRANQGRQGRGAFAQLNLSDKQKEQLRKVMEEQRERVEDVLTPQQREQMRRNTENRRGQGRQNFNR